MSLAIEAGSWEVWQRKKACVPSFNTTKTNLGRHTLRKRNAEGDSNVDRETRWRLGDKRYF